MQQRETDGAGGPFSTFTFETFVPGCSNQLAFAAAKSAAANPGGSFNPLFVHADTSLGKTHLLHAIRNQVLLGNSLARTIYVTAEVFLNEMVSCIQNNRMPLFRRKYRGCDLLLLDDILCITEGMHKTQDELFHTFNALHQNGRQIVIASDLPPAEMLGLQQRLRSRFEWGLIVDIMPPDHDHRLAILRAKAKLAGVDVSEEVLNIIASLARRNVRQLEGALSRALAYSKLAGLVLTPEVARNSLAMYGPGVVGGIRIQDIQRETARHFQLKTSDLTGTSRVQGIALARQVGMYLSRGLVKTSLPEIGRQFGGRDHSTVVHAIKKIESGMQKDFELKVRVDRLRGRLEQMA